MLLAACAATVHAADTAPQVFRFEEDSYLPGGTSVVELRDGTLVCSDLVYSMAEHTSVPFRIWKKTPSAAQWEEFRKALDATAVWQWQEKYIARDIRDGGGWSLEIRYKDRQVKSAGRNAYPETGGKPQKELTGDETATYRQFSAAVEKLVGDPQFKWDYADDEMMGMPLPAIIFKEATVIQALDFLAAKGTEFFKNHPEHQKDKLEFVYRYDTRKPRPVINYKRESISLATAFKEVLQMEGLDYQILGPHKIAIIDRVPATAKVK